MPILNWLNKDQAVTTAKNCDYRLLEEVHSLSYGDTNSENLLIQGDNLEALKALIPFYAGKVKCIFIDPPYNTKSAFEHYDDNLEHSKWLSLMYPRLELLRELLSEDGSIWVTIDDNEVHYIKLLLDEIFGRNNFLNQVSVKMKQTSGASGGGEDVKLKKNIEYVLVYSKYRYGFSKFNSVYEEESLFRTIEEMRSEGKSWKYTRVVKSFGEKEYLKSIVDGAGQEIKIFAHSGLEIKTIKELMAEDSLTEEECYVKYFERIFRDTNAQSSIRTRVMEATDGCGDFFSIEYTPKSGRSKGKLTTLYYKGNNRDLFAWLSDIATKKGKRIVRHEKVSTYWDGFPLNNLTKEGSVRFANGKKPEKLLERIIKLSTEKGDLVLDSFLGSGTTAAVAHKMNRRYIGIEIGEHAQTHCHPRLEAVVKGEESGISKDVDWQGGGGFKFIKLGQTVFDGYGCLNKDIKFPTLAAHIWYLETKQPMAKKKRSAYLGVHGEAAYYLLYNGILGDRRSDGGNVLTSKVIKSLPSFDEHLKHNRTIVIYGESTRLGEARLHQENIVFKQIPYDVGAL